MAYLLQETFTAADGTVVDSRPPDKGLSWLQHSAFAGGQGVINNNAARSANASFKLYYNPSPPPSPDYMLTSFWTVVGSPAGSVGIYVRLDPAANTYYRCYWNAQTLFLQGVNAGAQIFQVSTSMLYASFPSVTIELRVTGSFIEVLRNGSQVLSQTDATITGRGRAGFHVGGETATGAKQFTVDSLSVLVPSSPPKLIGQAPMRAAVI